MPGCIVWLKIFKYLCFLKSKSNFCVSSVSPIALKQFVFINMCKTNLAISFTFLAFGAPTASLVLACADEWTHSRCSTFPSYALHVLSECRHRILSHLLDPAPLFFDSFTARLSSGHVQEPCDVSRHAKVPAGKGFFLMVWRGLCWQEARTDGTDLAWKLGQWSTCKYILFLVCRVV